MSLGAGISAGLQAGAQAAQQQDPQTPEGAGGVVASVPPLDFTNAPTPDDIPPHFISLRDKLGVAQQSRKNLDYLFDPAFDGMSTDQIFALTEQARIAGQQAQLLESKLGDQAKTVESEYGDLAKATGENVPQQKGPAPLEFDPMEQLVGGLMAAFDPGSAGKYGDAVLGMAQKRQQDANIANEIAYKNEVAMRNAAIQVQQIELNRAQFAMAHTREMLGLALDRQKRYETALEKVYAADEKRKYEEMNAAYNRITRLTGMMVNPKNTNIEGAIIQYRRDAKILGDPPELIEESIKAIMSERAVKEFATDTMALMRDVQKELATFATLSPAEIDARGKSAMARINVLLTKAGDALPHEQKVEVLDQFRLFVSSTAQAGMPYQHMHFMANLAERQLENDRQYEIALADLQIRSDMSQLAKDKFKQEVLDENRKFNLEYITKMSKSTEAAVKEWTTLGAVKGIGAVAKAYDAAVKESAKAKNTLLAFQDAYNKEKAKDKPDAELLQKYQLGIDMWQRTVDTAETTTNDKKAMLSAAAFEAAVAMADTGEQGITTEKIKQRLRAQGVPEDIVRMIK